MADTAIVIKDVENAEGEAIAAALSKTNQYVPSAICVTIYVLPREKTGWLEYGIQITFRSGRQLYLGMIQRDVGKEFEFHS